MSTMTEEERLWRECAIDNVRILGDTVRERDAARARVAELEEAYAKLAENRNNLDRDYCVEMARVEELSDSLKELIDQAGRIVQEAKHHGKGVPQLLRNKIGALESTTGPESRAVAALASLAAKGDACPDCGGFGFIVTNLYGPDGPTQEQCERCYLAGLETQPAQPDAERPKDDWKREHYDQIHDWWTGELTKPLKDCDYIVTMTQQLCERAEAAEKRAHYLDSEIIQMRDEHLRRIAELEADLVGSRARVISQNQRIAQLEAQLAKANQNTSNLLARIHRDGGHHEAKIGTEQAVADADLIVATLHAERDQLRAQLAKVCNCGALDGDKHEDDCRRVLSGAGSEGSNG